MDPERALPQPQSQFTPPVHALDEDTSETIQRDPINPSYSNAPQTTGRIDTSNFGQYAANAPPIESPYSENLEPMQSSLPQGARPFENRETEINNGRFSNTMGQQIHSGIDYIVPTVSSSEGEGGKRTVQTRLQPTIESAKTELSKYSSNAKWKGHMFNFAIGMQVLLGSLTTGLSALAASGGKSTAAATTALGALATLVASYLARERGSNEPEQSIARVNALEEFIRECKAFTTDYGDSSGKEFDARINRLRRRFEEILGNLDANGEQKKPAPTGTS